MTVSDEHQDSVIVEEDEGASSDSTTSRATASALPLVVGAVAEAGGLLRYWMRGEVTEQPGSRRQLRHGAIGLTVGSAEKARRGLGQTAKISRRFGSLLFAPGRAVARGLPARPLKRRWDQLVERGATEVQEWIERGQETEEKGREAARATLSRATSEIVNWLGDEPAVEGLIDRQVVRIVPDLANVPEVETLVQTLADNYIAYLSERPPQAIERLIRSQVEWALADLLQNPPPAMRQLVREQVETILPDLLEMPELDDVVRTVADNYIAYLQEHPELVESLIRYQGDVYITYLTQNPEQVQTLVQGQSTGMVNEVTEQVRSRAVTADSFLEMLARSLLRRGERRQLGPTVPPDDRTELVEGDRTGGE